MSSSQGAMSRTVSAKWGLSIFWCNFKEATRVRIERHLRGDDEHRGIGAK